MSSIVPKSKNDNITFFENHISPWDTNAVAIGTNTLTVQALGTLTTTARAKFNAQQAARQASEAATNDLNIAIDNMNTAGGDIIKAIRAKAATSGNNVYTLAQIPAPAAPSPVGPPGTPFDFKVELFQNGSLKLKWKCNNPPNAGGTIYQVYRRVEAGGPFTYLGGTGGRDYTDSTLPIGSSAVTYQIQGTRSTNVGAVGQFNVNFGTTSGGSMTASVTVLPSSPKLAA